MALKNTLQYMVRMGVIAAALSAMPETRAQADEPSPSGGITQRIDAQTWHWGSGKADQAAKKVYESLPDEYKIFANKTYTERKELQEEWAQRDFIKRDQQRKAFLKQKPNARVKDFYPQVLPDKGDQALADCPVTFSSLDEKIFTDTVTGNLSPLQAQMAREVMSFGRPLATINPRLPYAKKLDMCGFDILARLAAGEQESSLTPRDFAISRCQWRDAQTFNDLPENQACFRGLHRRLEEERLASDAKQSFLGRLFAPKTVRIQTSHDPFENVNGQNVFTPHDDELGYDYEREVTYKVAKKIAVEDANKQQLPKRDNGAEM